MPEIEKASVAAAVERVTTQKPVIDCSEDVSVGQIVGEAIRDWEWKRRIRDREIERLPKR